MFRNLKFKMPPNSTAKTIGNFIEQSGIHLSPDCKCCIEAIVTKDRVDVLKTLADKFGFKLIDEKVI